MIDVHTHVLNGFDDGAADKETALALLKMAAECGTTTLFCTPHVIEKAAKPAWPGIVQATRQLADEAHARGVDIQLLPGAEVELNWDLFDSIGSGGAYCLGDSGCVLLELPSQSIPAYADDFFYCLQLKGIMPILAHPERHEKLMRHPDLLLQWMHNDVLTQCNAGSFTGAFGEQVKKNAELLLQHNMVCFIGSDAHKLEGRNTDLTAAANCSRV